MAEAYSQVIMSNGFEAEEDLTQYSAVIMGTADNQVKVPTAKGAFSPGVVQEAADDGYPASVMMLGISPIIVTEAVDPGNELTVAAADGKYQKAVSTDWVSCIALQTAAADGDQIAAFFNGGYIKP